MDCNKEEAVRAKELAEKKMEIKDFSGALKIAVKAQQLYPELENVSQLILVCEVHCSAEKKSYGTDKDWYGILKVEPTADDTCIKKQYRKLALLLHPDKNNFSGSTDAFKLIGEAQRVLLDREKRMVHDSKRRAFGNISASGWIPKQPPSRPSNPQQHHPWNHVHPVNLTGNRPTNSQFTHQRAPTGIGGHLSVFWTVCPFCKIRYHFYRDMLNKVVSCQGCMRSFFAYESNAQGAPAAPTTNINQTRHHYNNVSPNSAQKRGFTAKPVFEKKEPPKAQGNVNRKRKKRIEESSESSDSSESSESEEDVNSMPESESGSESDDDTEETEPAVFECPDPEFSDFDKHKKEECFRTGQLWACYDTEDAMPRFYALIKKISPGFKLQIIWLKPDPITMDEKKWVKEDLPVSCGRYKHEKLDKSEDLFSFSHLVRWEAGPKPKTVNIFPRKGETWAVFKNWSMNWHSSNEDDRKYEYEFVEILSDYDEKVGVRVSYLEKVWGFVCIFRRKQGGEMVIAGSEKYRFAHMIPSCRMSGEERDGVPKGSYELDPSSLPSSAFE